MKLFLQKIFGLRDQDIRKYGRLLSVLMLLFAFGLVVCGSWGIWLVESNLRPSLHNLRDLDREQYELISNPDLKATLLESSLEEREIGDSILDGVRGLLIALIALGFVCLYTSALLWRAYEVIAGKDADQALSLIHNSRFAIHD
jgi:uncharacterized membrane protein